MKFKTHVAMQSYPDFNIETRLDPVDFNTSIQGSCEGAVSSISVTVDEIPIRVAVPFLKRREKMPVLASIGGLKITLSPFQVKAEGMAVQLQGVLGTKGITGKMDGKVNCKTEMEMDGRFSGKVGNFMVKLSDEELDRD